MSRIITHTNNGLFVGFLILYNANKTFILKLVFIFIYSN